MRTLSRRPSAAVRLFAGASLVAMAVGGVASAAEADGPLAAPQATAQTTNGPSTNVPTTQVPSSGSPTTETQQKATSVPVAQPDGSVAEVVVTGFRSSLRNAIAQKRTSDQIVESISAEDIGKLPDNSIAESIARLPGVTAQRLDGRDSSISIRGLAPDFSTTLLNGREQVSTGNNRSAEFDQYPSELIAGVVVYKTPEAGLVGQGLSGTVDLRTIRPLDYKKRVLSFNARGEIDTLGSRDDNGYRVSGTYVDQFANDTIGVSFGVANEESPNVSDRYRVWGYPTANDGALLPGGFVAASYAGSLKRTGVSGTLQWRPNSKFSSTLDLFYSDYLNSQDYHGMEGALGYGGNLVSINGEADGVVTSGTYNGFRFVGRNDLNRRQANLYSAGWNNVWEDGPWKLVGDVSYSGVRRRDIVLETYSGTGRQTGTADTINFATDGQGNYTFADTLNRGDPNVIKLTSPQGWGGDVVPGGQDGYLNKPLVRDELLAYRGSAAYTANRYGIKSVEVGGNFTRRFKSYTPDEFFLGLNANLADPTHTTSVNFPTSVLNGTSSLDFINGTDVLNADPIGLISTPGLYSFLRNPNADVLTKGWKVRENVSSAWVKANVDQPFLNGDITGNIGIQVVYTDQSSTGDSASGAPIITRTFVKSGDTYTEPLPSINLNYRMSGGDVVRLGLARTLARARLDQLNASVNYSFNETNRASTDPTQTPFSGGGGNPKLHPWIADSLDISYEHYFSKDSYISFATYYKYLESYIYNQTLAYDFSSYVTPPCPVGKTVAQCTITQFLGPVSAPANGSGGNLYGFEATAVTSLTAFAPWFQMKAEDLPWLDGFGFSGSFSYTESDVQPAGPGTKGPLPGLSKYVANGTLYYEKGGFSARISTRYRSKYLGEVTGFGAGRQYTSSRAETIVDAQVGYTFNDGRLKGLGILLQGNNLTNEPFQSYYNGDTRQTELYQEYGQRILFGISYKY